MLPLARFLSFIELNNLFNPEDRVLLAVSGGKDSVLMAHLFNAANFNFGIAHCNFKLRGEESDADEQFTRKLAEKLGVPFYCSTFNTEVYAKENTVSIQMAARTLRYNWFEEVSRQNGFTHIAIAHHQSDTTETVLLNLVRGTGIAGLHGIIPKRGKLVRPLLFLSGEEINQIVEANKFEYRDDSSNLSTKYARNKIRLEVIPKLKELNAQLDETFEKNSKRFKELEDFLNMQTEKIRKEIFRINRSGNFEINLLDLKQLQPAALLMYETFKPFNFSESVLEDLRRSWNGQPGKEFLSSTHSLLLDRDKVILSERSEQDLSETLILADQKAAEWGDFIFTIAEHETSGIDFSQNSDKAFFDESMLLFPMKIRPWSKGDYFYPFGMSGKKKLSDYFTSVKLSLNEKKRIPVLENGNGDIVWIAGYRTDDRYKIKSHTKKVIIFEKQKANDTKAGIY